MKELGEVTFTKEWMKALNDTRILALTHLKKSCFVSEKKKSAGINKSVIVNHTAFSMEHNSCVGGMVDI